MRIQELEEDQNPMMRQNALLWAEEELRLKAEVASLQSQLTAVEARRTEATATAERYQSRSAELDREVLKLKDALKE